jgi:hypothetical protein
MGGPARYLAHRLGCRVTGLDITPSRHESAIRLTRLVGLDQLVDFSLGNALDMPFEDARLRRRDWPGGVRELGEPHFTEITQRERVETAAAQRAARKPSGTGSDGSKEGRLECVFQ